MRVAVMGSWRQSERGTWSLQSETEFRHAAELLGYRLVGLGHSLVVGSDDTDTADYLATCGAVKAAAQATRRIHIVAPRRRQTPFETLRGQHPRLFVEHAIPFVEDAIPADEWAPAKVFQVRYADAVVVLGGEKGSQQAGLTAAVSGKRLVCIGSFGGAARRLNTLFSQSRENWPDNLPDVDTLGLLQNPWNDVLIEDVLSGLRALRKPRVLIIHGRAEDRGVVKSFLRDTRGLPEPVVLADLKTPSNLIPKKFEELASNVDAAIALCTPDDVGGLADVAPGSSGLDPRARQNVWLEIGWFWGRLGLRRVLILTRGTVEVPSDLGGVERYGYGQSPLERTVEIDAFLASLGEGRL
jgi:hypothetical protein